MLSHQQKIQHLLLRPGFICQPYNEPANLTDLDQGELKYHIDFHSVYATVLNKWLKVDDAKISGSKYDCLGLM